MLIGPVDEAYRGEEATEAAAGDTTRSAAPSSAGEAAPAPSVSAIAQLLTPSVPRSKGRTQIRRPATPEQIAAMRAAVRAGAADRPGVYRMIAEDGDVIYVGKSKRVRTRLLSYFRCDDGEKGERILRGARQIEWEYTPSEFAALLRELALIQRYRPRFNVVNKRDARHYAFVRVTRGPAPKLQVVRGAPGSGAVGYGPFVGPAGVLEAVRELSDALGLRDCSEEVPIVFDDQRELISLGPRTPGCHRYEIKRCLGPCVGGCSARDYGERVSMARAFLEGSDDGLVERFRKEMEAASARLEFERAAAFRNKVQRLEMLRGQFESLRFAVESLSFVYTAKGWEGDDRAYVIRRGSIRAEEPAPKTAADRRRLAAIAREVFARKERDKAPVTMHEFDEMRLVAAWFRRHPGELAKTRQAEAFREE